MLNEKYELIDQELLSSINSEGYLYRHKKSKTDIIVISNDDQNKVFSACFFTPVSNSKGIPHILEHSVLCGSRKYPLKDPFVELMKGSMNTFLNAMTFDDMTLFPIASTNDKDFKNLMDVYLDAVFYPQILNNQKIFQQEGWHYELDDELSYNGVVYNEMKGYMSSSEYILDHLIKKSLFPGSCYSYHSGGKPEEIVTLDYQEVIDFYHQHYDPSRCLLYLYGDIDVEERLQYLDENYLSHVDSLSQQERSIYMSPSVSYMEDDYDCKENLNYFAYNMVISDHHELLNDFCLELLDYILVSSPGALLRQALLKEGIGDDIYSSIVNNCRYPYFSIICMNASKKDADHFFAIVEDVFDDLFHNNIDEQILNAAFHSLQFKYRELEFGSMPKGLYYNQQILLRWLYNEDHIFDILDIEKSLKQLEKIIKNHQFIDVIQKLMTSYSHTKVALLAREGIQLQRNQYEHQKLQDIYLTLDEYQKQLIINEYQQLIDYQQLPETKEAINSIPLLNRKDLPKQVQKTVNEDIMINDVHLIYHDLPTHGIGYLKLNFDLRSLPLDFLPYAAILSILFGMVDTKQRNYYDFYDDMISSTGGIQHQTFIYDGMIGNGEVIPTYEIEVKILYDEINNIEKLIKEELFDSVFEDEQRILEILKQEKASMQAQFNENAHMIALNELKKNYSLSDYYMYYMGYRGLYQEICHQIEHFDLKDFLEHLNQVMKYIFCRNHLTVSYTGERNSLEEIQTVISHLCQLFPYCESQKTYVPSLLKNQCFKGFTMPSQVQFVAMGGIINVPKEKISAFQLLVHILRCTYLWEQVRLKGGAYGCLCIGDNHHLLSFVSYRDPHLRDTIKTFQEIPSFVKDLDVDERKMLQYIIGAVSERESPLSPYSIGQLSFSRYLTGISEEFLNELRVKMINLNINDIQDLYPYLKNYIHNVSYCIIGNESKIKENIEIFDDIDSLI